MHKRKMIIILEIGVACVLIISMFFFRYYFPSYKAKAREVAEQYLKDTYKEEMEYEAIRLPIVDPVLYQVQFHVKSNPSIKFLVLIRPEDLSLVHYPDNYLSQRFSYQIEQEYSPLVRELWGAEAEIKVATQRSVASFQSTDGLDENTSLEILSRQLDYTIYIITGGKYPIEDLRGEARKISVLLKALTNGQICTNAVKAVYYEDETEREKYISLPGVNSFSEQIIEEYLSN